MQRKIKLMIGILIMTGLIAGCWKVSKNLQKELKEEMETIGEAEKSDRIVVLDAGHGGTDWEGRNQWSERKRYQFNDYEFCKENFGKRKYTGNHDQRNR